MIASNCQSSYEWLELGLAVTLGIKTFIASYDYTVMNEVNTLKMFWKYLCYAFGENHWKILAMQKQSFAGVLQSKCSWKGLQPCNFIKKRLQHQGFPVKFAKVLRIPFFKEHLWWLLLTMGAPYLVKLEVTFFIKKLNFIHQGFLP